MSNPYWPYWPMQRPIKYAVYEIEGVHDRPSGIVGVTKFSPHANSPQIGTPVKCAGAPATALFYHAPGQDPLSSDALVEAEWGDYIGEIAYRDTWQTPPLPILAPTSRNGVTRVTRPNVSYDMKWEYHVIAHGAWGPDWPDTIRTGLYEDNNDPHPGCAYNYVFQRGLGMVCFFYIAILPGETPKGIYYHATEW